MGAGVGDADPHRVDQHALGGPAAGGAGDELLGVLGEGVAEAVAAAAELHADAGGVDDAAEAARRHRRPHQPHQQQAGQQVGGEGAEDVGGGGGLEAGRAHVGGEVDEGVGAGEEVGIGSERRLESGGVGEIAAPEFHLRSGQGFKLGPRRAKMADHPPARRPVAPAHRQPDVGAGPRDENGPHVPSLLPPPFHRCRRLDRSRRRPAGRRPAPCPRRPADGKPGRSRRADGGGGAAGAGHPRPALAADRRHPRRRALRPCRPRRQQRGPRPPPARRSGGDGRSRRPLPAG